MATLSRGSPSEKDSLPGELAASLLAPFLPPHLGNAPFFGRLQACRKTSQTCSLPCFSALTAPVRVPDNLQP